jgi:class 3 adenylate cyclase
MIVQVRDDNLNELAKYIEKALDIIQHHNGIVDGVMASVIMVTFGSPEKLAENELNCAELAENLRRELSSNVRFLYGRKLCCSGSIISGRVITCGTYMPGFVEHLAELNKLNFGSDLEIR